MRGTARAATAPVDGPEPLAAEPLQPECSFDDFAKVDLRVARVVAAEELPKAKKLLEADAQPRRRLIAGLCSPASRARTRRKILSAG